MYTTLVLLALTALVTSTSVNDFATLTPTVSEVFRESVCRDDGVRPVVLMFDARHLLTYSFGGQQTLRWLVSLAIKYRIMQWTVPDPNAPTTATLDVTSVSVAINGMDVDITVQFEGITEPLVCGLTVQIIDDCDALAGSPERKREVAEVTEVTEVKQSTFVPCWQRRSRAECTLSGGFDCAIPGTLLSDCECVWDYPGNNTFETQQYSPPCPPDTVCCFNMPCDRFDDSEFPSAGSEQELADICLTGGGAGTYTDPATGTEYNVQGNCQFNSAGVQDEQSSCVCRDPLAPVLQLADIENLTAPSFPDAISLSTPYDCWCPIGFASPADWIAATLRSGLDGVETLCQPNESGFPLAILNSFVDQLADFIEEVNRQTYLRQCSFMHFQIFLRIGGNLLGVARKFLAKLLEHGIPARLVSINKRFCTIITPSSQASNAQQFMSLIDPELYSVTQVVDAAEPEERKPEAAQSSASMLAASLALNVVVAMLVAM